MTQPTHTEPPTDAELLDLTRSTIEQLNDMASKLEAYVSSRSPARRTRKDDTEENTRE